MTYLGIDSPCAYGEAAASRGGAAGCERPGKTQSGDECFLLNGFDSLRAVPGADPGDRAGGGKAGKNSETGQRRTRAPMTAETTDFHLFTSAGTVEKGLDLAGRRRRRPCAARSG